MSKSAEQTAIDNIRRSVTTQAENAPALGCGYIYMEAEFGMYGDFVAIQADDNTAVNCTAVGGAYDASGAAHTAITLPANSCGDIVYRPMSYVSPVAGSGAIIAYKRCKC